MHEHHSLYILQNFNWLLISCITGVYIFILFLQSGLSITSEKKALNVDPKLKFFVNKFHLTVIVFALLALAFFYAYPLFFNVSFKAMPFIWFSAPVLFMIQGVAYFANSKKENKIINWIISIAGNLGVFFAGVSFGSFFSGSGFMITTVVNSGKELFMYDFKNQLFGLDTLFDITNFSSGLMILFLSRMLALLFIKQKIKDEFNLKFRKAFLWNSLLCLLFSIVFFTDIFLKTGFAFLPETGQVYFEKLRYLKNFIEMPVISILFILSILLIFYAVLKSNKCTFYLATTGIFLIIFVLFVSLGFNDMIFYPSTIDFQSSISVRNGSADLETLYKVSYGSILVTVVTIYIVYSLRKKA